MAHCTFYNMFSDAEAPNKTIHSGAGNSLLLRQALLVRCHCVQLLYTVNECLLIFMI